MGDAKQITAATANTKLPPRLPLSFSYDAATSSALTE